MNKIKGEIPNITDLTTTNALNAIKNEITTLVIYSRKQIMIQKYQILSLNVLPHLVITNLLRMYLMQR